MNDWTILARFTSGFILAFASVGKLSDVSQFTAALRQYGLVPERLVAVGGRVLVVFEAMLTVVLFSGAWVTPALVITSMLFAGFAVVVAWALSRGRNTDCGCFGGVLRTKLSRLSVVANSAVAGLAAIAVFLAEPNHSDASPLSSLVIGACSLLLAGIYVLAAYAASVRLRITELGEGATA